METYIKTYSVIALLFVVSDFLILVASYMDYLQFSTEYFLVILVNILLYLYCIRSISSYIKGSDIK